MALVVVLVCRAIPLTHQISVISRIALRILYFAPSVQVYVCNVRRVSIYRVEAVCRELVFFALRLMVLTSLNV